LARFFSILLSRLVIRRQAFFRKRVSEETIENLLPDVFLRIHIHADTPREEDRLESWIYQIARHRVTDYYRRQAIEARVSQRDQVPGAGGLGKWV
jgi:DNA-directed RNA polymerase specialized sigma24 family protein